MAWTLRKDGTGRYIAHDGTRDRAWLNKYRQGGRSFWRVTRLHQRNDGTQLLGGADIFANFAKAKAFITNNPGVWGV